MIILAGIVLGAVYALNLYNQKKQEYLDQLERDRVKDCEAMIAAYSSPYDYIYQYAVDVQELYRLTKSGARQEDLAEVIAAGLNRPGSITLGWDIFTHKPEFKVIWPGSIRTRHMYVIGKSGYGKTNLLRNLIYLDIKDGAGVGVLAPEYEMLTEEILPKISPLRFKDVIFFNPLDLDCPVVLNPLHLFPGDDIDLHVDELFTILQRITGEGGPRMNIILRQSLYALTERPGSTLLDIEPLLDPANPALRQEIIRTTQDDNTRNFFANTYPGYPKDAHLPVMHRIGPIVRAKYVRNCLCPPQHPSISPEDVSKRLLNIRQAMNERKILLFNVSDGLLGQAASQLIGQFIVSKFQTAAMSRASQPSEQRVPFYLYLDEFQNFVGSAAQSYEKILTRARKYQLGIVLAHQQTGQLPPELLKEIFGCVSTIVSFQLSHGDAVKLAYAFKVGGNQHQPTPEILTQLQVGDTYCRIAESVFPMFVPKDKNSGHLRIAQLAIQASRNNYGIPKAGTQASQVQKDEAEGHDPLAGLDPHEVL